MIQLYRKCETITEKQQWLRSWKDCGADHVIECQIAGSNCYSDQGIRDHVSAAWRDARMLGTPEVELLLRRGGVWCGSVYLSALDTRAVVVDAEPGEGKHWFDHQSVSSGSPGYLIVQPNGQFERRTINAKLPSESSHSE
jgi:hypothetical protein